MENMALTAATTLALAIEYFTFSLLVGAARRKTGIKAPATSGDPFFEATLRVQQNTLEQLIYVIPSLWVCSIFYSELFAVTAGTVFFFGRIMFCVGYRKAPERRAVGFITGWLASIALILGGCWGVILNLP